MLNIMRMLMLRLPSMYLAMLLSVFAFHASADWLDDYAGECNASKRES